MAIRFSETFSGIPLGEVATAANTAFNETVGTGTMVVVEGTLGRAVRMDTNGTTIPFAGLRYNQGATAPLTRWYRVLITPRRLPPTGAGYLFTAVRTGGTLNSGLRLLDSGLIHLRNGATNQTSAGQIISTPAVVGTPWRLEYRADADTSTHTARIFRGGDLYGTTPTEVITAPLTTAGTNFTIGAVSTENAAMDFEAIVADDADWPTPPTAPAVTGYVLETWGTRWS